MSFLVHQKHRHLANAAGPDDQGLLDIGATTRSCDEGQLRGSVFGIFPLHGLEGCPHSRDNLLRGGIYQQDVGQGVCFAGLGQGIGKDDATRLRHQALATRQADEFLLRLTLLALRIWNAIFIQ